MKAWTQLAQWLTSQQMAFRNYRNAISIERSRVKVQHWVDQIVFDENYLETCQELASNSVIVRLGCDLERKYVQLARYVRRIPDSLSEEILLDHVYRDQDGLSSGLYRADILTLALLRPTSRLFEIFSSKVHNWQDLQVSFLYPRLTFKQLMLGPLESVVMLAEDAQIDPIREWHLSMALKQERDDLLQHCPDSMTPASPLAKRRL